MLVGDDEAARIGQSFDAEDGIDADGQHRIAEGQVVFHEADALVLGDFTSSMRHAGRQAVLTRALVIHLM